MSVGLRSSTIEVFRTRNHGNNIVRLYKLNSDGNSLSTLYTLHRGFFIGSNTDTSQGAAEYVITIDIGYTQGLTAAILEMTSWLDLINPDDNKFQRFKKDVQGSPPLLDSYRFMYGLHAALNDKKLVV